MSPWNALRKLQRQSTQRQLALSQALVLLPLVHAAQQKLPFERWRRLLSTSKLGPRIALFRASARDVSWAVQIARRELPGTYRCLPSAYATHLLLHLHGHASQIHVGVAKNEKGEVEAHAWVEHEGRVVIGALEDLSRFIPLPSLDAKRS